MARDAAPRLPRHSNPSNPSSDRAGSDGRVGNLILRSLPRKESSQLFPLMEFVRHDHQWV